MSTDEYVPSEDEMVNGLVQIPGEPAGIYRHVLVDEMKRGLARVRRDAALALAEHFSAESIEQGRQGNPDGADVYRIVAAEIEKQIPEETP